MSIRQRRAATVVKTQRPRKTIPGRQGEIISPDFESSPPDGPWLDAIDITLPAVVDTLRGQGMVRLAEGLAFDADHFREINPAWEGIDDQACRRAWLLGTADAGQPATPAAHLRRLGLSDDTYPSCFPWEFYAGRRPQAGGHRWAALEDFVTTGGQHAGADFPFEPDAAGLLAAVARQRLGQDDATAIRLYERASALAQLAASDLQHLADAYLRQESWCVAAGLYDTIIAAGAADGWTYRNRVHCAVALGRPEAMLPVLARIDPRGDPLWDSTIDLLAECTFNHRLRRVEALLAANTKLATGATPTTNGWAAAEAALHDAVDAVAAIFDALAEPRSGPDQGAERVLILADLSDAEAAERRVRERVRRLATLDLSCQVVAVSAAHPAYEALPPARLLILFATPAMPAVIKTVVMARRRGTRVCYETAEDISLPTTERALASWQERMGPGERDRQFITAGLRRAAARLCDFAVAPTARLAAGSRKLTREQAAFVVRDSHLPAAARSSRAKGAGPGPLVLCTRRRVMLAAEPGSIGALLLAALRRWPTLRLRLCGPFELDLHLDAVAAQIVHTGGSDDAPEAFAHWPVLAEAVLHLAWSDGGADGDAAAGTACAEAAALGVPSLLYAPALEVLALGVADPADAASSDPSADRIEAMVVRDPGSWMDAVADFLAEPLAWRRQGEDAAGRITRRHGPDAATRDLAVVLAHAARPAL